MIQESAITKLSPYPSANDVERVQRVWNHQQVANLLGLGINDLPAELKDNLDTYNVGVEVLNGCEVLRY